MSTVNSSRDLQIKQTYMCILALKTFKYSICLNAPASIVKFVVCFTGTS